MKANEDIREYIKSSNVKSYEVAQSLGLDAPTFSRKLQTELSLRDKNEIKKLIDQLAISQIENQKNNNQKSVFNFDRKNIENNINTMYKTDILKLTAEIRRLALRGETKEDYIQLSKLSAKMVSLLEG